jgi:hypothetical protein
VREYFGKFGCDSTIFVSYGRRRRKKEKEEGRGRRKKEEGRRRRKLTGSLALAGNRDPEALPRLQKNRRQSNSEMRSQPEPGNEEKTTFYKICLLPKTDYPPAAKAPIIAIDKAKPGNSSNPNIKASCPLITFS